MYVRMQIHEEEQHFREKFRDALIGKNTYV
jgi:hypothetical protein